MDRDIVNITPATGEMPLFSRGGRWLYCNVDFVEYVEPHLAIRTHDRRYLHLDCDVLCDRDGRCMRCGAPSPSCMEE